MQRTLGHNKSESLFLNEMMKTKELKSAKEAWEKQKKQISKVNVIQKKMVVKQSRFYEIVPTFLLQLMRKGELAVTNGELNNGGDESTKRAGDDWDPKPKLFSSMAKRKEGAAAGRTFKLKVIGENPGGLNPISREQFAMVAAKTNPQNILNNQLVLIGGIGSEYVAKLDVFDLSKISVTRH